jgi:hypothetical protein
VPSWVDETSEEAQEVQAANAAYEVRRVRRISHAKLILLTHVCISSCDLLSHRPLLRDFPSAQELCKRKEVAPDGFTGRASQTNVRPLKEKVRSLTCHDATLKAGRALARVYNALLASNRRHKRFVWVTRAWECKRAPLRCMIRWSGWNS